ncbi:MAG: DUF4249 domain-containing protein [Bacteroidota bacterium]
MKHTPIYLLLFCLMACIEPFDVDIPFEERFLVVEGQITDQREVYTVKLSYSSPVSDRNFEAVTNADVRVETQAGLTFAFTEGVDGNYLSDSSSFQGQIGEEYRLLVDVSGQSYASDLITLKASPPIDSLYWEFDERTTESGFRQGAQIFVDTRDPEAQSRFYRYDWVATWKYGVILPANYEYIGNNQTLTIQAFPICYRTEVSDAIIIASSAQNDEDRLLGFPIHYVTTNTNRLDKRYSLFVRQYVMSEEEFFFWKTIKESTENIGTLFDRQPQSRLGNLQNLNNPAEPVLGYFSASAVSSKRVYVDRSELPAGTRVRNGNLECFGTLDTLSLFDAGFNQEERDFSVFARIARGEVFYDLANRPVVTGYIFTTPECSDCREQGGTEIVPDFWEE